MKIEWSLDEEEGINPIDPLGNITLSNEQTSIEEKDTYLDSWFIALLTGVQALQSQNSLAIDLVEEPNPLILENLAGKIKISYKNQTIVVGSNELLQEIKEAGKAFLAKLNGSQELALNSSLKTIGEFFNQEKVYG